MKADLVLRNGKIIIVDERESIAEAVAVKFGRIIAVGDQNEINIYVGPSTKIIELKGRTVIPGLMDSHSHMADEGAGRMRLVDLSQEAGVQNIKDIQERLRERAKKTPKGTWVFGYQEDDSKLAERRHPTRWELDIASRDHPLSISTVGGHFSVLNSKAFEMAGVTKETPDPIGGKFDRNEAGEITGGAHEKALNIVIPKEAEEPSKEQSYDGAKAILRDCASVGLTCVYDLVDGPQIRALIDLNTNGELPVRMRMDATIDLFPELNKAGIHQMFGDDMLRLCGLKFFFDGAISARTAAVTEPYCDKPGFYGVMSTNKEIAEETLERAYAAGYRVSCHANGDRAIAMYLDIMEKLQVKYPRKDPRNRDIHCTVITKELVKKIKRLDILPTIFGPYPYYHGDKLLIPFGEERLERMFAARTFLDAGIKLAAHSDHPCAPFPPLMAIHALVNRTTKAGKPIGRSQKISVMEALKLYTINSAYQSFDEDNLGSIEMGKLADMVILSKDILTVPMEEIKDITVEATIVNGNIVYERKQHS
jgi:predicted amidohydrolase YtcJ